MKRFIYIILFIPFFSYSQEGIPEHLKYEPNLTMEEVDNRLYQLINRARECEDAVCREGRNIHINDFLREAFTRSEEMFKFSFDSTSTVMSTIKSPDNAIRFFNWNLKDENNVQFYYCYILKRDLTTKEYTTYELNNKSRMIFNAELKTLNEHKWFGALYYDIIPVKKNKQTYYTLLAWDGKDSFSSRKIIDVLQFKGQKVIFGESFFKHQEGLKRRIILEYKSDAACGLLYNKKNKAIVYDYLMPMHPSMEGMKDYYIASGSYDAMVWDNSNWIHISDYDAKSSNPELLKNYNAPKGASKKDIAKRHNVKAPKTKKKRKTNSKILN